MASSNKTEYLGLNRWIGSDRPMMEDFNADNQRLDLAVGPHLLDQALHAVPAMGSYSGDGTAQRSIEVGFEPGWGMVFEVGANQVCLLSQAGCGLGVSLNDTGLSLDDGTVWNVSGKTYAYLLFRQQAQ